MNNNEPTSLELEFVVTKTVNKILTDRLDRFAENITHLVIKELELRNIGAYNMLKTHKMFDSKAGP